MSKFFQIITIKLLTLSVIVAQYDYSLEDLNSSSPSYGESIGASYFQNHVTLHYFGHFT